MRVAGQRLRCSPVGQLLVTDSSHRMAGLAETVVALPRAPASTLLYPDKPGTSSRLDIRLHAGVRPESVIPALESLAKGRAQVRTASEEENLVGDVTTGMELGFTIGGIGSLVVGLFLVYNALAVSVAERRKTAELLHKIIVGRSVIVIEHDMHVVEGHQRGGVEMLR